ncbi:hypothetical protein F9K33_09790 [bacterium]|nr:MAG: hypothetical protein F9K33_09790 [bacterium]
MNIERAREILSQYDCEYSDEEIEAGLEFLKILIDLLPNVNEIQSIKSEEARLSHTATFSRKKKSGASSTGKKTK